MSRSKESSSQCGVWSSLGFETFELLAMGMLIIFLKYKIGRKICSKDGILAKRREAKLHRDARIFEKLKIRFENAGAVIAYTENDKKEPRGPFKEVNKGPVKKPWTPFVYEL